MNNQRLIDTDRFSAELRKRGVDSVEKRILLTRFPGPCRKRTLHFRLTLTDLDGCIILIVTRVHSGHPTRFRLTQQLTGWRRRLSVKRFKSRCIKCSLQLALLVLLCGFRSAIR